jgi:predicted SAM-dependent methyltransferase
MKFLKNLIFRIIKLLNHFISIPKWKVLLKKEKIWLELGSGVKKGKMGWITVDDFGADICHDLTKGIPLPNESVDQIYTSHMLEHIPFKDLVIFINECFRVLKKNGSLSVCVPDASLYIKSYIDNKRFRPINQGAKSAIIDTGSFMDQVNYIAYMDQLHKYMFDSENLVKTLSMAPFTQVSLRDFDESVDLKLRNFESIYAIAIK